MRVDDGGDQIRKAWARISNRAHLAGPAKAGLHLNSLGRRQQILLLTMHGLRNTQKTAREVNC